MTPDLSDQDALALYEEQNRPRQEECSGEIVTSNTRSPDGSGLVRIPIRFRSIEVDRDDEYSTETVSICQNVVLDGKPTSAGSGEYVGAESADSNRWFGQSLSRTTRERLCPVRASS